jgi:hypothetical protein
MKPTVIAASAFLWTKVAFAQDPGALIDEKTHELTNRGLAASAVAAAQVSEMHCGKKGQIAAMLQKAEDSLGVHLDLNDRADLSSVLFFATRITDGIGKDQAGWDAWCGKYDAKLAPLAK